MTTIACDGDLMASDSQSTDGNGIYVGPMKKIFRLSGGGIIGCVGRCSDAVSVVRWMESPNSEKPKVSDDFAAVYLCPVTRGAFLYCNDLVKIPQSLPVFLGSGYEIAMGAYDVCRSLERSIEAACKFDTGSGGDIQTERLSNG